MQRARHRPHDLQPARQLHGAPHRRLRGVVAPGPRSATSSAIASAQLFPDHFIRRGDAAAEPGRRSRRPASPSSRSASSEYGFVGINLNPDPSGGHWTQPAADRPPLVSDLREDGRVRHPGDDPRQHELQRRASTPPARTTSTPTPRRSCSCIEGDLFKDFPTLRFVIPHGGGAVPYHWGRYPRPRAGAEEAAAARAPAEERLLRHLRLPPAGHRPADAGDPGRRTSCSPAR